MDLVGDRRGQSIQIGAVLLFGLLIVAFSSYQAFVVPEQNREVEFNHNQEVQSELQDLRNAIVSIGGSDDGQSVTVQLGTRYPTRLAARNPGPPSGSLETVGTDRDSVDVTIANARVAGETGDYWNESRRYGTGVITYRPNYNVYANAPTTTYGHTALYDRFGSDTITVADQSFIDGTDISLVVLDGALSRSSTGATSVDIHPISSSTERIRLDDAPGSSITITFTSMRSATYWDVLENTQPTVRRVTSASKTDGFYDISVELDPDRTYSLGLTKVGVGTGVTSEEAAYLTDVDGDSATVSQGEATELTLEIRDRFNNPPSNVADLTVSGSVVGSGNGELERGTRTPDADGRVTFVYEATGATGKQEVQFSYTDSGTGLDTSTPESVSMTVDVTAPSGGGGGAYAVDWLDPSGQDGVNCPDGHDGVCTVDSSQVSAVTLSMGTSPVAQAVPVEYAVNSSSTGVLSSLSGTTGVGGQSATELSPISDGGLRVYTTAGSDGDTIVFDVINPVTELVYNGDATAVDGPDRDATAGGVEFSIDNLFSQDLEVRSITVDDPDQNTELSDTVNPNDQKRRTEVFIEGDLNDGYVDINGGTDLPNTFDLDSDGFSNNGNPKVSPGGQLSVSLFEFEDRPGIGVDMTGNEFEVTLRYALANGTTGSKTFTVIPS